MNPRSTLATLLTIPVLLVAGCGNDGAPNSSGSGAAPSEPVVVSAAASLQTAFTAYGATFGGASRPRFSFAGSDALAAQIKEGVRPDVFAAANTKLPDELFAAGLVEKPTVFAGNRLVLAVTADEDAITGVDDLADGGVKLAIGSDSVPIGAYTAKVLGRLPAAERDGILANVKTEEPDVKGIVGKLTQGAVDAGFVYITDVTAAKGALRAIELPAELKPSAAYGVAVVKGAEHSEAAKAFIDGLLTGQGRDALTAAGFEAPQAAPLQDSTQTPPQEAPPE